MGAIELNYVDVHTCDDTDGLTAVDDGTGLASSDYPQKQGDDCMEWEMKADETGGYKATADPAYDCRLFETGIWFLNPFEVVDGKALKDGDESSLRLRLYSGSNWADYYQTQHMSLTGEWKGGWLYLRASGGPGAEDNNSGTWGVDQCASIDAVCIYVKAGPGNTSDKDSGKFGIDWFNRYDKIIVKGDNDGSPWTLKDIVDEALIIDSDKGEWGMVKNEVDFYEINAGIDFGDGVDGSFKMTNEYLLLSQWDEATKQHITVKDGFEVQLGVYDAGEENYAKEGIQLTADGYPNMTVENGAKLKCYDSKIQGFENIIIGDGTDNGGDTTVEILKCDLFNNNNTELNHKEMLINGSRFYFSADNKKDIGSVLSVPRGLDDIEVFQVNDGFDVRVSMSIDKYKAGDTQHDVVVKDSETLTLTNASIDGAKLKRSV